MARPKKATNTHCANGHAKSDNLVLVERCKSCAANHSAAYRERRSRK
jgi:hypothetical protein